VLVLVMLDELLVVLEQVLIVLEEVLMVLEESVVGMVHGMQVRRPTPWWSCPWEQRNAENFRDKDHERVVWLAH
jgi:hypothetical protein